MRWASLLCFLAAGSACSRTGLEIAVRRADSGTADAGVADLGDDAALLIDAGCPTQVSTPSQGHTCAVSCGEVWCWGDNGAGQLGDGTVHSRGDARRVEGIRARQVSTNYGLSCAVRDDRQVACWGYREGDFADRPPYAAIARPALVRGVSGAREVSLAERSACVLLEDQSVQCWQTSIPGDPVPVRVDALERTVKLTASLDGTCALDSTGTVRCRFEGADWTELDLPGPAQSLDGSCAVISGRVYCWGFDQFTLSRMAPRRITLPVPAKQASGDQKCGRAVATDGRVWSWGDGSFCRLWRWADRYARERAIEVDGLRADAVSSTCAWSPGGRIWCWGHAADGDVGDGRETFSSRPIEVDGVPAGGLSVSLAHACAYGDGSAECWGSSGFGEVGGPTLGARVVPEPIALSNIREVVAGTLRSCAVTESDELWCWGRDAARSYPLVSWTRPQLVPMGGPVMGVALADDFTCVVRPDGSVDCSGFVVRNLVTEFVELPGVRVLGPGSAERVVAALAATCGISSSGVLTCTGENVSGDLGIGGATPAEATPLLVVPDVLDVAIGYGEWRPWRRPSCLIRTTGELACWGYNAFGQVGDGTSEDRVEPTRVTPLEGVTSVDIGAAHTCAVDGAGTAWCWGNNRHGQLGDGTEEPSPVPVRVLLDEPATRVSIESDTSCAQTISGRTYCWGSDQYSLLARTDPPPTVLRPQRVILAP